MTTHLMENIALKRYLVLQSFAPLFALEGGVATYTITMDEGEYLVSVDEGPERPISTDVLDELMNVIGTYDVAAWDGFKESDYNVEDGENFLLEIRFTDGTGIVASGDNAFPDNYSDAMEVMWRILTWNAGDGSEQ